MYIESRAGRECSLDKWIKEKVIVPSYVLKVFDDLGDAIRYLKQMNVIDNYIDFL